jgi:peptide deformylase
MYEYDGVGLAAVQIGRPIRMAAIYVPNSDKESLVLVNPRIVWMSEETQSDSEGCLSVPEIRASVNRPLTISVSAVSPAGEPILLEKVSGSFARTIQHEMDHMDGVLFVDKIDPLKKTLLFGKLKKLAKKHKTK